MGLPWPPFEDPLTPLTPFCCWFFIIVSIETAPLSPLMPFVVTPPDEAAFAAASCAFSSRNCRYVLVFGTVSERNSRLSILDIAVAARMSDILPFSVFADLPISLYAIFRRGFRSDFTTLCACSAKYRTNSS